MLVLLLLFVMGLILFSLMSVINSVLSYIPFYTEINNSFAYAIGLIKGFFLTVPYLEVVYNVFLVIITVEAVFLLAKFILGSRNIINN